MEIKIVVFLDLFRVWGSKNFKRVDVITLNTDLNIKVGWEEGVAEVFKEVFLEIIDFSSTEVVESFDLVHFLTGTGFEVIWNTNDASMDTCLLDFFNKSVGMGHGVISDVSEHEDSVLHGGIVDLDIFFVVGVHVIETLIKSLHESGSTSCSDFFDRLEELFFIDFWLFGAWDDGIGFVVKNYQSKGVSGSHFWEEHDDSFFGKLESDSFSTLGERTVHRAWDVEDDNCIENSVITILSIRGAFGEKSEIVVDLAVEETGVVLRSGVADVELHFLFGFFAVGEV